MTPHPFWPGNAISDPEIDSLCTDVHRSSINSLQANKWTRFQSSRRCRWQCVHVIIDKYTPCSFHVDRCAQGLSDWVLTVEHPATIIVTRRYSSGPGVVQQSAMSSLVRSFASLYCQKLRSTTRLGPVTVAPPRFQALNRRGFSASSGAADARRPPAALPMPSQQSQQQKRTPFFTW